MRQAGVLAAAGLLALQQMPHRLPQDHANARHLAEQLATIPGIRVHLDTVKTNIVFFDLTADFPGRSEPLAHYLQQHNIWISPTGPCQLRAVTHYWITAEHIEQLLTAIRNYEG